MLKKIFIYTLLFLSSNVIAQKRINTIINPEEISIWAIIQHKEIEMKLYHAIKNNTIALLKGNSTLNQTEKREVFKHTYIAFINTDQDDPTIGKDTTVVDYFQNDIEKITETNANYSFKFPNLSDEYSVIKSQLMKILSPENTLYLQLFKEQQSITYNNIKTVSSNLYFNLFDKLYNYSISENSKLYQTDSLTRTLSNIEKEEKSKVEIVTFIKTDPEDSTIGMDSVYYIKYNSKIKHYKNEIYCNNFFDLNSYKINSIACSRSYLIYGIETFPIPIGFINFKEANLTLNNNEIQFINYLNLSYIIGHCYKPIEYDNAKEFLGYLKN